MTAYVDYVDANEPGYRSLVKAASGANDTLREIYDEARAALTDRIFREDAQGTLIPETPHTRLLVRGWAAMAEELVLGGKADPVGARRGGTEASVAGIRGSLRTPGGGARRPWWNRSSQEGRLGPTVSPGPCDRSRPATAVAGDVRRRGAVR